MRRSLRTRLTLLWIFIAVVGISLAAIMLEMYRQGAGFQIETGLQGARNACQGIENEYKRYRLSSTAPANPPRDLLYVLLDLALRDRPGVEGGIWHPTEGFIAYAFPTYEGSGVKRDVPEAEEKRIATVARQSLAAGTPQIDMQRGQREVSLVAACPLPESPELVAWTLRRVPAELAQVHDRLALGLGILLLFVIGSGVWLASVLYHWSRQLTGLERALSEQRLDHLPQLSATGEQELDRIVAAVNRFSASLREALDKSAELSTQLAQADRLAALGRMAAALAHEIRNPIAAMRLKAENALAQPGPRQQAALETILTQVERLDKLLASMLAMTQPLAPGFQRVNLGEWMEERAQGFRETAQRQGIRIAVHTQVTEWVFDPLHLARAVDNLLWNSLQHSPPQSEIRIEASLASNELALSVTDEGSGIAPEIRKHLFEPFASGRPDGTGLGLALVREIMLAHGGSVRLIDTERGACFELRLPWRAS